MSEPVEFHEGELDGHTWRATWESPVADNDSPPRAWRIVVDAYLKLPYAAEPHPLLGAEACRTALEAIIQEWLAQRK